MRILLDVKARMRDGVELSADVYLPEGVGPHPCLLLRSIYDKQQARYVDWAVQFVAAGYVVVLQDCRGRHDSDGAWEPYIHEADDGFDTHEWIGRQPWCDGSVGTFGISYLAFTQTLPATQRSRFLRALAPIAGQQDNFGHFYVDGALQLHVAMNFLNMAGRTMKRTSTTLMDWERMWRRLPLVSALDDIVDLPFYRDVMRHPTFDDFWRRFSLRDAYGEVDAPAYFITGWYDNLVHEAFKQFNGWRKHARSVGARERTRLLVGPWSHQNIGSAEPFGAVDFGGAAGVDIVQEQLRWFDQRLKGIDTGIDDEAPVRIFVMGRNTWRSADEWPPAGARPLPLYLQSSGPANSSAGGGKLEWSAPSSQPPDRFDYDPNDPVPTLGGHYMMLENSGPWDRRPVERRDDVLVYTSDELDRDIEVTGAPVLEVYASSSAPDTDFTAALVDVHPDGRAVLITEGLLRTRYRHSIEAPELMEPGEVYRLTVRLWETSNLFKQGHRIRLEVSSSNFPRFDRNPNTGEVPNVGIGLNTAQQTIYHDPSRQSRLILPTMPG